MITSFRRAHVFVTVLLGVCAQRAVAQQRISLPKAGPGVITGVIVDTRGRFVDSAEVTIQGEGRRTFTDRDGVFRFTGVKPERYNVAVRKVGFYPTGRALRLLDDGATFSLEMTPVVLTLPSVVTSAVRGGISGVVAVVDSGGAQGNVLAGAKVEIVSTVRRAETDSGGSFFVAAPAGKYMVSVKADGYATKVVSVTVPPDSGRRILVWLSPGGDTRFEKDALAGLRERLAIRNVVYSALLTREDIALLHFPEASQLANVNAARPNSELCPVIIAGNGKNPETAQAGTTALWMFKAADIEMMERYETKPPRQGNSIKRKLGPPCDRIILWLRK